MNIFGRFDGGGQKKIDIMEETWGVADARVGDGGDACHVIPRERKVGPSPQTMREAGEALQASCGERKYEIWRWSR